MQILRHSRNKNRDLQYDPAVSAQTLNRLAVALAFAGMFVAGTLTLAKSLAVAPPCGIGHGCADLTTGAASIWWGLPIARVGLVVYLILAVIAIARQRVGLDRSPGLLMAGHALAAAGTAVTIGLLCDAVFVLHVLCPWCLASAFTMIASLAVYEAQRRTRTAVAPGPDDLALHVAFTVVLILVLGFVYGQLQAGAARHEAEGRSAVRSLEVPITLDSLIGPDAHVEGPAQAPVTIVEFGDLTCAACRRYYSEIHGAVARHPGAVRFVFHNLPLSMLPTHENAFNAAVLSEMADEEGRFFDYVGRAHALPGEPPGMNAFVGVARACGVDVTRWKQRALESGDPAFARVFADMELARRLGISSVPTYFLCMPASRPEPQDGIGMSRLLADTSFVATLDRLSRVPGSIRRR